MDINFIQGLKHTNKIEELKKKLCLGLIDNLGQPTDKESEYLISMISGEHNSLPIPSNRVERLMYFALIGGNIDLLEKPNSSWSRKEKYWYAVATGYKNDVIEPGAGCSKEDILDYWLALYSAVREWLEVTGTKLVIPNSRQGYSKELAVGGRTWQNLVTNNTTPNIIVCDSYKDMGDHLLITKSSIHNTIKGYYLFNNPLNLLKPNTKYTVVILRTDSINDEFCIFSMSSSAILTQYTKSRVFTFTTENTFTQIALYIQNIIDNQTKFYKDFMVFEGDLTTSYPTNYIQGIESLGSKEGNKITVQSSGKNIININKFIENVNLLNPTSQIVKTNDGFKIPKSSLLADGLSYFEYNFKPNTQYTYSYELVTDATSVSWFLTFRYTDGTNSQSYVINGKVVHTSQPNKTIKYVSLSYGTRINEAEFKNLQIEEGTVATTYQPYQANIVDWQLTEPLRSLPNGVCDEVDKTGLENRRIGKRVFKGGIDEYWSVIGDFTTQYVRFSMNDTTIKPTSNANDISTISDRIQSISHSNIVSKSMEGVGIHNVSQQLNIVIDKAKLSTQDIQGFKAWLQANNVTVLYELATPTTKQLEKKNIGTFEGGTIIECTNNAKGSIIATVPVKNTY